MAMRVDQEIVNRETAELYRQADTLEFSANVRTVESFGFQQFPNLTRIEFEEGVTAIGTCAFQGCNALRSVRLPQSLHEFGQGGAFRDCPNLVEVTFNTVTGNGDCIPENCRLFANSPVGDDILRQENRLRRGFHLRRIFDRIAQEELFQEWVSGYRLACQRLEHVADWRNAGEELLQTLVRNNDVAFIGEGETAMPGGAMQPENYGEYREIAFAISEVGRTQDWNRILPILRAKRERFFGLFHHANNAHPWTAFNRIVAGLSPSLVVNVPRFEDLNDSVYSWLSQRRFIMRRQFQREEWFELSHEVRNALSDWLHPHDIFECGQFAWSLAERMNDGMRNNDARIPEFRQVVNQAIESEEAWFTQNANR